MKKFYKQRRALKNFSLEKFFKHSWVGAGLGGTASPQEQKGMSWYYYWVGAGAGRLVDGLTA